MLCTAAKYGGDEVSDRQRTNENEYLTHGSAAEHSKFWQHANHYFDRVYKTMNLDPIWREVLSSPKRVLIVSRPVRMDDGHIQVFTGYRAQHNHARGRSKAASALIQRQPG